MIYDFLKVLEITQDNVVYLAGATNDAKARIELDKIFGRLNRLEDYMRKKFLGVRPTETVMKREGTNK